MNTANFRELAAVLGAIAVTTTLVLTGCTSGSAGLEDQYRAGSNKGYIAGDGSVTVIDQANRGESIVFDGIVENGAALSSTSYDGQVVVVNFWYAACAPCRAEAPILDSLSDQYVDRGANFVGVNVYDQPDTAVSFAERYGITYPSIIDVNDGATRLAFTGEVPPQAVPTTIVLDKQGRVAARILGQIQEESILDTLIRDTIAES